MAQIRIPCLVGKTNKAKITSWYWQPSKTLAAAGWKPLTLGKDEGAAIAAARARNAEIEAWKAGGQLPLDQKVKPRRQPGTVAALIARYRREHVDGKKPDGRDRLRPKTRESYDIALRRIEEWAGKHPVSYITPARVRTLRDATARPIDQGGLGHAAAFNLLKTLRQLFAFAESVDMIPRGSNPATSFNLSPPPPRSSVWERDDDAAFDAAALELGMPGMVLAREIALYSAQREGDLIAFIEHEFCEIEILDPIVRAAFQPEGAPDHKVMGWVMAQTKTSTDYRRTELSIPFDTALAAKVAAAIRTNRARDRAATPPRLLTHVLVDESDGANRHRAWKKRDFCKAFRKILDKAAETEGREHMAKLTWHDLKRTRVVRLRRKGYGKEAISAITGLDPKTIDAMLKVYGPIDPTITARALADDLKEQRA